MEDEITTARGKASSAAPERAAPRRVPPPPTATATGRRHAGAVLRRVPDPDRPGSWRDIHPRIVDNASRQSGRPSSDIVDNKDTKEASQLQSNHIVDNMDSSFPEDDISFGQEPSPESFPLARQEAVPEPTKLKKPSAVRKAGPSGPDSDTVRRLREARKRKIADRARSLGRDPNQGAHAGARGMTRSHKTHEQYVERGKRLVARYRRETGLPDGSLDALDPIEFVNWFFSLKPTLKPTAWRPYRQSAKALLSSLPHESAEAAIAMIDADVSEPAERKPEKTVSASPDKARTKMPRRTSALKAKKFPKEDFDRILTYLRRVSWAKTRLYLADWMVAGIATGLRPIEWQATDFEMREDPTSPSGRRAWLYVLNAKATNGRGNGLVRTLDLSLFSDETLACVRRMSDNGSSWLIEGKYDSMQSQCAQLLDSVCDRLFGKKRSYSLYSLRHQFVANMKSLHQPEFVSALVGHVVTDTAISSYGKKRSCWEPEDIKDRPEAVPEEVATVRQRLVFFRERVRIQQEAGLIKAPNGDEG